MYASMKLRSRNLVAAVDRLRAKTQPETEGTYGENEGELGKQYNTQRLATTTTVVVPQQQTIKHLPGITEGSYLPFPLLSTIMDQV